jgi:hypothetical protein
MESNMLHFMPILADFGGFWPIFVKNPEKLSKDP